MANMSYCRFENTARDLDACEEALLETLDGEDKLSETELRAAKQMMNTMARMLKLVVDAAGTNEEDFIEAIECETMDDIFSNVYADLY